MISLDSNVEIVQPASPPGDSASTRITNSPEIRVTDSPSPKPSSQPPHHPFLFQPFLPAAALMRPLPFSIDNILKPNFGIKPATLSESLKTEPSEGGSPVDLSKVSPPSLPKASPVSPAPSEEDPKKNDDCPPGMVRGPNGQLWPAWVFCTRYSDRPSSGPRARKIKKREKAPIRSTSPTSPNSSDGGNDEKRPRTAFSSEQLARLRKEFEENRYLNEERRRALATELNLNETQIKIWFQNKRAKLKKSTGGKGDLAKMLEAQGLYNHATVPVDEEGEELLQV